MAFDFLCVSIGSNKRPRGVKWRSSISFVTFVVFLSVFVDLLVYSIIIPVIPFRLEELGHKKPSVLAGWLLVAYSLGLILSTPPLAYLSERYWSRRTPLIVGLLILIGAQVLFMEARAYWLMCVARVLQGISSAAVWVVSFSLLCDTVPEKQLGQQLGIVMSGLSLGFLIGPPIGGVLNEKLGYRSPFICAMIVCFFDLISRLLVVEKNVAKPWLEASRNQSGIVATEAGETGGNGEKRNSNVNVNEIGTSQAIAENAGNDTTRDVDALTQVDHDSDAGDEEKPRSDLSIIAVLVALGRSKRTFTVLVNVFVYGIVFTIIEPTLPLRLQDVYGYKSLKVGIIFLAAVVPSLISTPLSGWLSDRIGMEWVTIGSLLLSLPWWIVMAVRGPVVLLVASLALGDFFLAAVTTPLTAELAIASKQIPGIGYAHVFGAFNFAYSCASAVGPLIGGQIYGHVKHGWTVIMGICSGLMVVAMLFAFYGIGEDPLYARLVRRLSGSERSEGEKVDTKDKGKQSQDGTKSQQDGGAHVQTQTVPATSANEAQEKKEDNHNNEKVPAAIEEVA